MNGPSQDIFIPIPYQIGKHLWGKRIYVKRVYLALPAKEDTGLTIWWNKANLYYILVSCIKTDWRI